MLLDACGWILGMIASIILALIVFQMVHEAMACYSLWKEFKGAVDIMDGMMHYSDCGIGQRG